MCRVSADSLPMLTRCCAFFAVVVTVQMIKNVLQPPAEGSAGGSFRSVSDTDRMSLAAEDDDESDESESLDNSCATVLVFVFFLSPVPRMALIVSPQWPISKRE